MDTTRNMAYNFIDITVTRSSLESDKSRLEKIHMTKFCSSCGKEIDESSQFCNACGAPQTPGQGENSGQYVPPPQADGPTTTFEAFSNDDIEKNKVVSALAYLIFFLPLIACPESGFGRFHANQGLLLLIVGVAGNTILSIIPIIGWVIIPFFSIATLAFAIIGFVNAINGNAKELPLFGQYRIIR